MKISSTHILTGFAVIGVILLVGGSLMSGKTQQGTGVTTPLPEVTKDYSSFASCLAEKGAKFYGAFWCPHCSEQKALFGKMAVEKLPYVECSNPDKKSQTQVCIDAKITGYPTWELAGGERLSGSQTLATLAAKTSCVLPE